MNSSEDDGRAANNNETLVVVTGAADGLLIAVSASAWTFGSRSESDKPGATAEDGRALQTDGGGQVGNDNLDQTPEQVFVKVGSLSNTIMCLLEL